MFGCILVARTENFTVYLFIYLFLTGLHVFSEKGEFGRFFDRLDRPVKESRPDRFPSLLQATYSKIDYGATLQFLSTQSFSTVGLNRFLLIAYSFE